ncbi:hypothetical protein AGMMS49982_12000 [Bacteroidia bacterium]|nr:hypothetical protein AGMMS49982_12000 [Bacteroidia bacterium]
MVEGYDTEKHFPTLYIDNKGVGGYTIQNCKNLNLNCSGSVAVMLVGTNNLHGNITDENFINAFIAQYIELVDSLHADRLIAISILPRNNRDNTQIRLLNNALRNALSDKENVTFLDVFDAFSHNAGINPEYTTDGVHLSHWGYVLLTERLNQVL